MFSCFIAFVLSIFSCYNIIMKKLALKKINLWLALAIILIVSASGIVAISANAFTFLFGGRILTVTPCIQDTLSPTCYASCTLCGHYAGACNSMLQITFMPVGGNSPGYICPQKFGPFIGGFPRPGAYIIGNGLTDAILFQTGVSRL